MHKVTKQYRTETGHRLDDYDGKCSHLHGHSYLWEVTVQAENLTPNGMVTDFKNLKAAMKEVLEPFDHAMVLSIHDPLVVLRSTTELMELFIATNGANPRLILFPVNPTAENFAAFAADEIQRLIWETGVTVTRVRVWETVTSFADWEKE